MEPSHDLEFDSQDLNSTNFRYQLLQSVMQCNSQKNSSEKKWLTIKSIYALLHAEIISLFLLFVRNIEEF